MGNIDMYGDISRCVGDMVWHGKVCELDYVANVSRVQKWVTYPEMVGERLVCRLNCSQYHMDMLSIRSALSTWMVKKKHKEKGRERERERERENGLEKRRLFFNNKRHIRVDS